MTKRRISFIVALAASIILAASALFAQPQKDSLVIKCFPSGIYDSNVYVVSEGKDGFIIDAGSDDPAILDYIKQNDLKIHYIFLTHAHLDHATFAPHLKAATGAEILMHKEELKQFDYPREFFAEPSVQRHVDDYLKVKADRLLNGDETFTLPNLTIKLIPTPGHAKGAICLLVNDRHLFSGDTLFLQGIGRTDITTGNYREIVNSIRNVLFALPDTTIIYPGHGPSGPLSLAKSYFSN